MLKCFELSTAKYLLQRRLARSAAHVRLAHSPLTLDHVGRMIKRLKIQKIFHIYDNIYLYLIAVQMKKKTLKPYPLKSLEYDQAKYCNITLHTLKRMV